MNVDEEACLAKSPEPGMKKEPSAVRGGGSAGRLHCRSHRDWVEKRRVGVRLAGLRLGQTETSFVSNTGHMQQTCPHKAVI